MPESTDQASSQDTRPEFNFVRVYLKDASFETPHSPGIFNEKWEPNIKVEMDIATNNLDNDFYEVVLDITITATQGERTGFLCEIKQAGIFLMKDMDSAQRNQMLSVYCPDALYPFAREAVTDLISKGGFPQLLLAPVDFNGIYQQKLAQAQAQAPMDTESNQEEN